MKTRTIIILSMILLMAAATFAAAQPGSRGEGRRGAAGDAPFAGRLCDKLNLSEEQQATIDGIREQSREQSLETRKQIKRLQNDLEGLMLEDAPDTGDVAALVRRIGELRTDQQVRRMETRLAVRSQLTDEQRDKMIAMGGKRHGRGGPGQAPGMRGQRGGGQGRSNRCKAPRGR
jgi:Spy/CpxP family protein refolding chaperone